MDCEKCKAKTTTVKSLALWKYPTIFIINLKRYTQLPNGYFKRNNCIVDFSPTLTFSRTFNGKEKIFEYELLCVVNHFGNTPMGGHYTTLIKHNTEEYKWIHIDDCNIYKSKVEELVTQAAYILIYRLK